MSEPREVVITGMSVVSPIGIGSEAFWKALCEGRSGVAPTTSLEGQSGPQPIGGEVRDFEAKKYVRQRKSLKVMSRDIQLAVAAAEMACKQAAIEPGAVAPERIGVNFGADLIPCELDEMIEAYRGCLVDGKFQFSLWGQKAMSDMFPLWMLKYLPNMPACHIAIGQDARGPSNSITLGECSSLAAIGEAARVIQRGAADVMIAGGSSSRIHPMHWARREVYGRLSQRLDDPAAACRPFDADRDGTVLGEGAASFVLEDRSHAQQRGATILGRLLGHVVAFEPQAAERTLSGSAIRRAITTLMRSLAWEAAHVGHVNAHGQGSPDDDPIEAQAIHKTLGDVPVTAPKSYFGNMGAGTGAVELAVSLLACQHGQIPATLNYHRPDPNCPVNVVHGQPLVSTKRTALALNYGRRGRCVALAIAAD